jgi:hypothetical protein
MDLNIDNYTYTDLLNVFKITNNNSLENVEKMNTLLKTIKDSYPMEIVYFFTKAYNVISSIFNLHKMNRIESIDNFDIVNDYYYKIKNIKNLENKNVEQIIYYLEELQNDSYVNSYVKILPTTDKLASKNNRSLYNNIQTNVVENILNNSIAPGNINSIKRITKLLNLNMNSCFRSNYFQSTSSDFQYNIPSEIKNVVSMRLISIEMPKSWYLISKNNKNNIFEIMVTMIHDQQIASENFDIEIPEGNYTAELLEDFLNKTYFFQSTNDNLLKYIRFSINPYSNKTSFEILSDFINISIVFSDEYNDNPLISFGWLCGFRMTNYLNVKNKIVSEGIFDNGNENYIYVIINDYQYNTNHMNIVGFDKSVLNENVIAKVLFKNTNSSFILSDNNPLAQMREYNGPVNISKLHIKLIDKFGTIINLNNMDIAITIQFEILYESYNFKNVSD